MTDPTRDQLRAILEKLDDVCRQARELQDQVVAVLLDRPRVNAPTESWALLEDRRKRPRNNQT
jgi:hypothetical protein